MKKKKLFLFSWYFPSFPGGAEKSILEELKKEKSEKEIYVISFDERYKQGEFEIDKIKGFNYPLKYTIKFSRFWTFFFNYRYVTSILEENYQFNEDSEIWTQSIMTPIFSDFCIKNKLQYTYYLRDENHLNEFKNYWKGVNRFFKYIKDIIDFIPVLYYKKTNLNALKKANLIVANSKFIAKLLSSKFKLKSKIIYPHIDYTKLKLKRTNKKKYIVFIGGDNAMKGSDIVEKIAAKMSNQYFLIVGNYSSKKVVSNKTYVPWTRNILDIYNEAKIVLVPSRWQEAYGRTVVEANYLNIPTISSNRGGLPEANKSGIIINNLEDISLWVKEIKNLLKNEKK